MADFDRSNACASPSCEHSTGPASSTSRPTASAPNLRETSLIFLPSARMGRHTQNQKKRGTQALARGTVLLHFPPFKSLVPAQDCGDHRGKTRVYHSFYSVSHH